MWPWSSEFSIRYGSRHLSSTYPNDFLGKPRITLPPIPWETRFIWDVLVHIGVSALRPSDSPRRSRIPPPPQKIESGTRDHSENAPECTLDPGLHPVVVKIGKKRFLGGFWDEKGPKSALTAASLTKIFFFKSPKKNFQKNIFLFFIFLSDASRKIGLGGLWTKSKIYLFCHFLELNFFAVRRRGWNMGLRAAHVEVPP